MNTNKYQYLIPNKLKSIIIGSFVLICTYLYLLDIAQAQDRVPLVISPARQQINVNPGEVHNLSVKFINESSTPLTGTIKAVDFIVTEKDGNPTLLDEGDTPISNRYAASSWVKLPYERATIAANDVLLVNFKLDIPVDANPGGRYVAVYFETTGIAGVSQSENQFSAISSRVVSLTSIRVNGAVNELAIISGLKVPNFMENGPVNISFDIFNKGDLHITPTGQVILKTAGGREIERVTLEQKNVFPDAKREYLASIGKRWMMGKYNVEILAAYGESGMTTKAVQSLWIVPVTLIVVVLLSITILILSAVYIYRKVVEKQKTLERKLEMEIDELESLKNKFKDKLPK